MKKAVVVFYDTKYGFLDVVLPRFRRYAAKIGADMVEINMDNSTNVFMDKFFYVSKLSYERCLILDVDILLRNDTPDLFSIVPEDSVGVFDEGAASYRFSGIEAEQIDIRAQAYKHLVEFCDFDPTPIAGPFSFHNPLSYYNIGVVVYNREAMDLDRLLSQEQVSKLYSYRGWSCAEQTLFSYLILKSKIKVFNLSSCFNHMCSVWSVDYLKTAYICHYAGRASTRQEEIIRDDLIWKSRGL